MGATLPAAVQAPEIDRSPLLTLGEVLRLFAVSRWTFYHWRRRGIVPEPVYLDAKPSLMRWREAGILAAREALILKGSPDAPTRRGRRRS